MSSKTQISFRLAAFSTNYKIYSPLTLIRHFLISSNCDNICYIKDNHIEYEQRITKHNALCKTYFVEIYDFDKQYHICSCADAVFIFFDLEKDDSMNSMNKIFSYIKDRFCLDRIKELKIEIIGFYLDKSKIIKENNEDNITSIINESWSLVDYYEVNLTNSRDLVNLYESITLDNLEKKAETSGLGWSIEDMSRSECTII
ncbi:MAG: hypothetical protein MJ252_21830 [archaeon]|nr:hypothetical protein [archaeon]